MQKAKPQGPARSPMVLSTPREASAKADVHCAMVLSEAPAQIIRSRKSQNVRFRSSWPMLIPSESATMGSMGQVAKLTML